MHLYTLAIIYTWTYTTRHFITLFNLSISLHSWTITPVRFLGFVQKEVNQKNVVRKINFCLIGPIAFWEWLVKGFRGFFEFPCWKEKVVYLLQFLPEGKYLLRQIPFCLPLSPRYSPGLVLQSTVT